MEENTSKKKKGIFRPRNFFLAILVIGMLMCLPEVYYSHPAASESIGSVRNGSLKHGWLMPHKGKNFHYFSGLSYYILNNAYVHSTVYQVLMDAYLTCEVTSPETMYRLMECSDQTGGKMWFHRTHQNGMSVDFMVPLKNGHSPTILSNYAGLVHYLLKFSPDGHFSLNRNTEIDFDAMAKHLIALDDAAKAHGLSIRKVLFHTDLHTYLFHCPSGTALLGHEINFTPHLSNLINRFHDDHYHVDFEFTGSE